MTNQTNPTSPEPAAYNCKEQWEVARNKAWSMRDINCGCDHNESCDKCYPADFRAGGKWHKYASAHPAPLTAELKAELLEALYKGSVLGRLPLIQNIPIDLEVVKKMVDEIEAAIAKLEALETTK